MPRTGRPTSYKPEYAVKAQQLCSQGATDRELADAFNVDMRTILRWRNMYEDFCRSSKCGKDLADDRVERSLYQRALGYSYETVKLLKVGRGKDAKVVEVPIREIVPPDTTACIFWLKNRRPQQWRDVHRHEHGAAGEFDRLGDVELRAELEREAAELGVPLGDTQH